MHYSRDIKKSRLVQLTVAALKFAVTVILSAVLSAYFQWRFVKSQEKTLAWDIGSFPSSSSLTQPPRAPTKEPLREVNGTYGKYLSAVLHSLRANRRVRIVKLELPQSVLNYQRRPSSIDNGGEILKLQARASAIPVLAVSRNSKNFLEEMRVSYIDPSTLPPALVQTASTGMNFSTLRNFLLIPDFSGENSKRFTFEKNEAH